MIFSKSPKKHILIVEDNPILADFFAKILSKKFKISSADCAEDAIFQIENSQPDLIWLDVLLRGHSAFALLNELQTYADTFKIPVIVCSDLAENLDLNSLQSYGVAKIFDKSKMTPREILTEVERILNEAN